MNDWLLWQLADSAFPTGGFAHSLGLEAAWQHGEVRNRIELISFIEAGLQQLGHAALPFVMAAFDAPAKLDEFDQLCDVFTTNHVANRASRAQGRAFLTAVERIFKSEIGNRDNRPETPYAHFAPVFGMRSCSELTVPSETTARIFFLQPTAQRIRGGGAVEHHRSDGGADFATTLGGEGGRNSHPLRIAHAR